jgi:hemoglobin-like flavoprotein
MTEVAGERWRTEFTTAWVHAYQVVADRMRFGAAGARRAA